ncbi:putative monovalent cation/H+ antiporter subunit F [Rubripirellula obstinata]|uniref:Putative monovalent cation/H+ antiporter subunit F n=1 Tax=Rubripirellula obstinata TaxID=406547 RepID=A0A5B1CLE8_9BACT|nr:monovalent cation/H+ antiporter complex subunit F [Rubripirellula obstinata]KAA1262007.1 putative monovalent cation/H+ antiporter subunit F [Rubripirellula obstinata]
MLDAILVFQTVLLLASLVMGLMRVVAGPTQFDRMLASQLIGTTTVGILILMSQALSRPAFIDVALVFALLAAVASVTFVQQIEYDSDPPKEPKA